MCYFINWSWQKETRYWKLLWASLHSFLQITSTSQLLDSDLRVITVHPESGLSRGRLSVEVFHFKVWIIFPLFQVEAATHPTVRIKKEDTSLSLSLHSRGAMGWKMGRSFEPPCKKNGLQRSSEEKRVGEEQLLSSSPSKAKIKSSSFAFSLRVW